MVRWNRNLSFTVMATGLLLMLSAGDAGAAQESVSAERSAARGQETAAGGGRAAGRVGVDDEVYNSQDPADSLYRAARSALNRGTFQEAADMFREVQRRYPGSDYVGKSLYWGAYSLYRAGGDSDLEAAREMVLEQQEEYPRAARERDSEELEALIDGKLAELGHEEAAARSAERARGRERERDGRAQGDACPDEDDDVRLAALNALLSMNAQLAVPILKKVLERRDECSTQLRRKAVFLLSQKRSDETVELLLDVARNDPDVEVREQAVFWLSQVSSEEAVDALEEILTTESSVAIQEKAIFALSQHNSERAGSILRNYAGDQGAPLELREKAIFWIGQHRSGANSEFLRGLYSSMESEELKEKIIFSVSQMGGAGNGSWLIEIALDESESVNLRKKAIFWAGQGGASMEEFASLYTSVSDREIKEQLIFAFSQSSSPDAADQLMDIARNEPDQKLRKKAIFWLGQSNDPRAAEFLLELINQ